MKHDLMVTRNQRVERITEKTLVLGVDVAKEKHVAQAADFRGRILTRHPIRFNNTEGGFQQLLRSVHQLQKQYGIDDVMVGMEPTGHYWFNLANWLVDKGVEVVLVNPITTHRNKENRDNTPSKSDPKDAAVIADSVARGYYSPYQRRDPLFQRLNVLARACERVEQDLTRVKNRIHGWLDEYFPEYESVFIDPFSDRSVATLHQCPTPGDLKGLSPQDVVDRWTRQGMRRPGGKRGLDKAAELLQVARRSIGSTVALEEAKWELKRLLEEYKRLERALKEADDKLKALLPEVPLADVLQTIGLTPFLCTVILAYAGDLSRYDHGNQLLRMAGLNLAESSSGKYRGKIKLSKRGNARLRKYLYLAVFHLLRSNPTFREWHRYNVETKGMTGMQSLIKLTGKLARILVAMARKNETFAAEVPQPQVA
ncbi:MAG: IS110 family transposase [Alicyclobacillaceae bacterium]|nr:IS110 family transposase [Alicyclobacillaceae bacterium]